MRDKLTRVLVVADGADSGEWIPRCLERQAFDVRVVQDSRAAELLCGLWSPEIVMLDLAPELDGLALMRRLRETLLPPLIIVVAGGATVARAVEALTSGAFSLLEKPVDPDQLRQVLDKARAALAAAAESVAAVDEHQVESLGELLSVNPRMHRLFELIRAAAPTDANVLIVGENGTGKELVASAVHELSLRSRRTFVRINCAAIPSELLESELFGYRRGAFTGALADRKGLFELADGGSVLLDEIGEMPPYLQAKLLRVLQDREFRPVGGTTSVRADFRLICATNVDPPDAIRSGKLREDLYFRLNTISLAVPPLRERHGDIPLLARHFLAHYAARHGRELRGFQQGALLALECHPWPGNVRELQHVVERAVILAQGTLITVKDLPESIRKPGVPRSAALLPTGCSLEELERLAILQTLELTSWNKQATARILGIHRPTLYNKLRKYRLSRSPHRPLAESAPDADLSES